jgi:hypothetical protein
VVLFAVHCTQHTHGHRGRERTGGATGSVPRGRRKSRMCGSGLSCGQPRSLGRFARAHKKKQRGAVAAIRPKNLLVNGIVLPSPGLLHVQIAPLLLREQLVLRA